LNIKNLLYKAKKKHVFNVLGIMVAVSLLLFSIWQWDIIVSGPVWWESSPTGVGWHWDGPGAYQRACFQCFLWKTTIGVAYDTLLFLMFTSFVLLGISLWFWNDE